MTGQEGKACLGASESTAETALLGQTDLETLQQQVNLNVCTVGDRGCLYKTGKFVSHHRFNLILSRGSRFLPR